MSYRTATDPTQQVHYTETGVEEVAETDQQRWHEEGWRDSDEQRAAIRQATEPTEQAVVTARGRLWGI